ncbi:hypothetical protein GCM10010435_23760 [Winogradskya consettensis]|uniref:Uncharacterized protein n=1 Tax=Winogradskya consettensis TaxID=113560 RepID=A0A919T0E9_9ACTN|nr:hypothetical protein Aco04nite_81160 [Actinoplanes consettensis]
MAARIPKAANRAANAQFAAGMRPAQDRMNELLREMGVGEGVAELTDGVYTLPDQTAILTVAGFEFERGDLPKNVHLIGVLPAEAPTWMSPSSRPSADRTRALISIPVPANAARVAHHRLGIDLATGTPGPEAVRAAVETLLRDGAIRANVDRLARVYAGHDPVLEIERLVLS